MKRLHGVDSNFFCCGLVTQGDTIVEAPPIIRYAKGRSMTWFIGYAMQRGWSVYSIL